MAQDDHSTRIQGCIDRLRSGDESARDELLARASERLTRWTRKMLWDFPGVQMAIGAAAIGPGAGRQDARTLKPDSRRGDGR